MNRPKKENRLIFHDSRLKYMGRVVKMNGVRMIKVPSYYKRTYKNETGGYTTEISIKPFKHEPDTQSNPR